MLFFVFFIIVLFIVFVVVDVVNIIIVNHGWSSGNSVIFVQNHA